MLEKVKGRKCRQCKKEFLPKTPWQRFCKRNCHAANLYKKKQALLRRAQKIIEAQERAAS